MVFVSYETLVPPDDVTAFVKARRKDAGAVRREIEGFVASERRESSSSSSSFTSI